MFKFENKRYYLIIYALILSLFSVYFLYRADFPNPKFEIIMFCILLAAGIYSIIYYTKNNANLHKVALVLIIMFGIISLFLTPIDDVSDEAEHFVRSEIISTGELSTSYVPIPNTTSYGYETINSVTTFFDNAGSNVFNTKVDDEKIDYTPSYFNSAFAQNPFYAYLAQGIGVFLAKCLDLNAIWMLWLGRFFNLLLYAGIITLAIKKAPVLKFPLLIVSMLPLAIYQSASTSCDGLFSALAILAFSYFLYFYKTPKISWKDLGIFYVAVILCGLLKSPYLALSLLLFLVPNNHFSDKKQNIISKLCILVALGIGLAWSSYATTQLANSWRGEFFAQNNVSASGQIDYLLANPLIALQRFGETYTTALPTIIDRFFYFSNSVRDYSSSLLAGLYFVFICLFSVFYPNCEKMELKTRVKGFLICALIYGGVMAVQYLTWSPVGGDNVTRGVFSRYFMPLLIFLPFVFGIGNKKIEKETLSFLVLTIAVGFISGMLMLTTAVKY
ncbi:DUF2142 domain-containing protein [uncultured Methanobrevibacter sp.]|uniref:DUF2142 domain-containing protein n=1 Tax=uncultured Methanobrevibacter sp. TaxID=253161 RepID=UPI00343726FF